MHAMLETVRPAMLFGALHHKTDRNRGSADMVKCLLSPSLRTRDYGMTILESGRSNMREDSLRQSRTGSVPVLCITPNWDAQTKLAVSFRPQPEPTPRSPL